MIKYEDHALQVSGDGITIAKEFVTLLIELLEDERTRNVIKVGCAIQGTNTGLTEREFLSELANLITKYEQVFIDEENKGNGNE